jgi:hypothetical protein
VRTEEANPIGKPLQVVTEGKLYTAHPVTFEQYMGWSGPKRFIDGRAYVLHYLCTLLV